MNMKCIFRSDEAHFENYSQAEPVPNSIRDDEK